MFDTEVYLDRLGYPGPRTATPETLQQLHKLHLMTIPYDNTKFGTADGELPANIAEVDLDATFDKIVRDGNGGICFELNPLFSRLLRELGFGTRIISAGVRQEDGTFSPDLSHLFTGVSMGEHEDLWLADVGFSGPSYLDPLRLNSEVQHQYGCRYKVVEQAGLQTLHRRSRTGQWRAVYRFTPDGRRVEDWQGFAKRMQEFTEGTVLANAVIRARSSGDGHMLLVGKRYLTVADGYEKSTSLVDPGDFAEALDTILAGDR
ncbi:arylamine N-acetyltransferase [Amycolatopsis sp. WQ 127309]|uniref:arylamine N-acetyltransferase family protein n=1 Tax=Amycolatopsis sp. WQ 127309 TaxID=2932773 RepID=UPI001FF5386F|nr:arylamine N-acetyltransferase [Amycolatopsis sp. WQ 127309]UOZ02755.1 arylamine N-acetyltransferase [Amycolatopsis sp. WQ 127309]